MEDVIIPDKEGLERKKKAILEQGTSKLHVVSDFDRTLTTAFVEGEKVPSLISVLRDGNYLTKDYAEKAHALFDTYHPIEINPDIPLKEKKEKMHEWWTAHFALLIKSGLNIKDLKKVVESGKVRFREGTLEFIDFLHKHKIPLVILSSAGLGVESISMYFEKHRRLYDNIYIISNSFEWDKNGNAVKVKEPIIHSMNKSEVAIKDLPVFNVIKNRKNILLLGDGIGDLEMVHGFSYNILIKIGFLNENPRENLEQFKSNFDIVLLNDTNMDYVNELLKEIVE